MHLQAFYHRPPGRLIKVAPLMIKAQLCDANITVSISFPLSQYKPYIAPIQP